MVVWNTKIHKKDTKLDDLLSLIGQKCIANILGNATLCIIKSIKIDSYVWFEVYNLDKSQIFIAPIDNISVSDELRYTKNEGGLI